MPNPISPDANLRLFQVLQDNSTRGKGRLVKLVALVNPQGADVGPWWQVENLETGRQTLIREDRLKNTVAWSFANPADYQ